jgi:hypothetical protein
MNEHMDTKTRVTFDHYTSGEAGFILHPTPLHRLPVPVPSIPEDQRVFDKARYATEVHAPVPVLPVGNFLDRELPRCLDMPIRLAGDTAYRLPDEWTPLVPVIGNILAIEHANNEHWADYHAYLTVDCSTVEADGQQRNGGLHVDGFQGARIDPKTKVTRNYVATSNGGTRFYPQLFNADLDDATFNLFEGFDLQAGEPQVAHENVVCFMDAYTVHESGLAARTGLRTFLRVTFDLKPFDRLGNTRNAMIDYDWDMVARTVHETLQTPTWADIEQARDARMA